MFKKSKTTTYKLTKSILANAAKSWGYCCSCMYIDNAVIVGVVIVDAVADIVILLDDVAVVVHAGD